ncbi:MAG: CbiQ family ECF transporter T component, partial [Nocardioidaceae bacterium]
MTERMRIGPLALLAACLLPVIGGVAINRPDVGLVCVAVELVCLGWLTSDLRSSGLRLLFGIVAAGSISLSTWLYGGQRLDVALGAALRILYLVLPAIVITPAIVPSRLGDHLAQRLHLPARPVVAAVASLQRLSSLGQQWQQIQRARRARGLGMDGGPVRRVRAAGQSAFALLVVSMRDTGSMALAM